MQIQFAAAKIGKYASSQSGDTLEMTERPNGGFSIVLADGQRSGRAAKTISNLVTSKAIALISEGVRDGAVARATHDYLYAVRGGKVSATLNIASVDLETKTLVLSRNSHCPIVLRFADGEQRLLADPAPPIGVHRYVKPQIVELPIQAGMLAVVYTDGIQGAGRRGGDGFDAPALIAELYEQYRSAANVALPLADDLLAAALEADDGRPQDDASVFVIAVSSLEVADGVRRLNMMIPIPPLLRP